LLLTPPLYKVIHDLAISKAVPKDHRTMLDRYKSKYSLVSTAILFQTQIINILN